MRPFAIAFFVTLLLFVGVNLLWAHLQSDCGLPSLFGQSACADDIRRAGFPLQFWEEGGFAFRREFVLPALFVDIVIGLVAAVAAGWAAQRLWPQRGS